MAFRPDTRWNPARPDPAPLKRLIDWHYNEWMLKPATIVAYGVQGALSFAIDGQEARAQVDRPREPGIDISKDGPRSSSTSWPVSSLEPSR